MLIESQEPIATRILSVRTDEEAFERMQSLAESLGTSQSVLLRAAISNLLAKQKKMKAKNLRELLSNDQ